MAIEPEFDLYDDLDDAFTEPLEKDIEKKKSEEHQKLLAATETAEKYAKLEKDYQQLKDENLQINKNLSLFTLTAKNEISRKDQQIKDLRRELDGMIFRRNKGKDKMCGGTATCDKFVQTEERSLGPKMFSHAEKSAHDRTKAMDRKEKSSERSNKSYPHQRSRDSERDRRYEREHSSKDQKSSSRDEERIPSSRRDHRKTSRDEQSTSKKRSYEEKSKTYRKDSTDSKKRSDDDLKSQKPTRDSKKESEINKFDDVKKSLVRLTDSKDQNSTKNRKRSRSRSVEKHKFEKRSKRDEQKESDEPKVADLRETLLKKQPNGRNEPRRESPRKTKQNVLKNEKDQVPVETIETNVPQRNPIETVTSSSSLSKDSIAKELKLELKASTGNEKNEISEHQPNKSKDGKTQETEISKIAQIIEVSSKQIIKQPQENETPETHIQEIPTAPANELEEGEINDDEMSLEPVSTLKEKEKENANVSQASNFASLNVSAFSDDTPKVLDESLKDPITLANDSLNSSGSKENSLNKSQENSKSKKRASYEKEVGQDGSVVLTIHRKTKKIKKKKQSA